MNLETEISRELWQAIRRSYESQAWSNAILDSIHYLSDILRAKTDLQSDGTTLVGQALGGKTPKLRLNRLQTESEKSVQAGVEQLLRGLYQAIRNPRSHGRLEDTQGDADALIIFVHYVMQLIGHARSAFSIEECVGRIVDKNFVPNDRYANLLVEEIPARSRLQVALTAYQRKFEGDGQKLRYFFNVIIPKLAEEEGQELFHAISADLKASSEKATLCSVFQLLHPDYWPRLDEIARLRSENRVIDDLRDGFYVDDNHSMSGVLATYSLEFWSHFCLKHEMLQVLLKNLRSDSVGSQDYVLKFCFKFLNRLAEEPPWVLQRILEERLTAGDSRFKEAWVVSRPDSWGSKQKWDERLQKALEGFQPSERVWDDDIPF